jgi:hypothetical protein
MKETKFVISLTTLPNRNFYLKDNLNSLLEQNYTNFEIHLNIPKDSPLNGEWHDLNIPNNDKLKIFWVDDIGSITKLYYTLKRTNDRIITVDDDFIYHPEMLNEYNHFTNLIPNSALGYAGIYPIGIDGDGTLKFVGCIPNDIYTKVGVLEGYKSVCYSPKWFNDVFFTNWYNKHYNDDLIISSWLGNIGIDRCIIPYRNENLFENRTISFPLINALDNPDSGQYHFRQNDGGTSVSYKNFYNSEIGKYIKI